MTVILLLRFQCGNNRAAYAHRGIKRRITLFNYCVNTLKAEPRNIAKLIGVICQNIYAFRSEIIVDMRCRRNTYVKRGQQHHKTSYRIALVEGSFYILQLLLGYSLYFKQLFGAVFNNVKGIRTETLYNIVGGFFAYTFYKAGG